MTALSELQRRLRERSEHYLRLDAMRRLRGDAPSTVEPVADRSGLFWRYVFVPLYRRVPWERKQQAMKAARMTATGWTPPRREPAAPWQPPASLRDAARRTSSERPSQARDRS